MIFLKYGKKLVGNWLANFNFSCFDLTMTIFPALFISLLMISFNLFGNGLRDALNPSLKGSD